MAPEGRLLDDHLHDVPNEVFVLLEAVAERATQPLTVILERDDRHILRFMKSWEDVRYLAATGKWGELLVYQPLKDFSLAIDVRELSFEALSERS